MVDIGTENVVDERSGSRAHAEEAQPSGTDEDAPPRRSLRASLAMISAVALLLLVGLYTADRYRETGGSDVTIDDDFEDERSGGLATEELPWEQVTGSFAVDEGVARVDVPNADGPRSIAVIDAQTANFVVSATAGEMTTGWGLVFRYVGPYNYWYLQAVPEYAAFNVVRVADGMAQRIDSTRLTEMRDGMIVTIRSSGSLLTIAADGREIFRRDDDHAFGGTRVGLVASGTGTDAASWDSFAVDPTGGSPAPAAPIIRRPVPTTAASGEQPVPFDRVGDDSDAPDDTDASTVVPDSTAAEG